MDQLKVTLRYLKRIHFWIICPLVTLLGIGAWYMAVGKLNAEKDANVGNIDGHFGTVQQVSSISPHANADVAAKMSDLITKTQNEIKKAWGIKESQQAAVLTWPDFPWGESRKSNFLKIVKPLRPIERMVKVDDHDRLNIGYREDYRDYILKELPKLAELAGAAWVVRSDEGSGVALGAESKQANTIVVWEPNSQSTILQKHFQWKAIGSGRGTPSTLQILYAQEDLWVLRHLMQIVARTNVGATTRHSAAVRKIIDIKIGKEAVYSDVTVEVVASGETDGQKGRTTRTPPARASDDANTPIDPAEGRYVDKNYEPLPAQTLRQVMEKNGDIDPEKAYLAVAKRIPVRVRVSIDQRHINRLLVECANSELTVEVRQLLISPDFASPQTRRPSGGGNKFAEGGFGGNPSSGANKDASSQFPFDLEVELYGIVSIYNPVDQSALGIETDDDDDAGDEEKSARSTPSTFTR